MSVSTLRTDALVVEHADGVATVTLNRPELYNAVDRPTLESFGDWVREVAADPETRCVVVTGAGKAFCTGADLSIDPEELDEAESRLMLAAADRAITALVTAPVPVVVAVNGPAAGVGASLAFAGDLVLAAESAYFLLPFTGIGLMPDGGATATVAAALGRSRAMRLALRGERLSAHAAHEAGLVAEVTDPADLATTAREWATELARGSRGALRRTKAAINAATLSGLPDALARESRDQVELLGAPDFVEGVRAFRERRTPSFM